MKSSLSWLPDSALLDGRIEAHIEHRLNAWFSARSTQPVQLSVTLAQTCGERSASLPAWRTPDNRVSLTAAPDLDTLITEPIIGVPLNSRRWNKTDLLVRSELAKITRSAFLDMLAEILSVDLRSDAAPSQTTPPRGDTSWSMTISLGNTGPLFDCSVDKQILSQLRRKLVASPSEKPQLHALSDGLQRQKVNIGAAIGSAQVSVREFKNLSEGDTIILDRPASSTLNLTLNAGIVQGIRCSVSEENARLELNLQKT